MNNVLTAFRGVLLSLFLAIYATAAMSQIIETVAGGGIGDGGRATGARLVLPGSMAVDSAGNFYFADSGRIRKVTLATGNIDTVAGTGATYYNGDNIPATVAALNLGGGYYGSPASSGIAVDASGNIFIADKLNHRVRKVTAATGLITTVAGTGMPGYNGDGGPAPAAQLNLISSSMYGTGVGTGVAVDQSGNLYIADAGNNRIRKVVASTGLIHTVAGTGSGGFGGDTGVATNAMLYAPVGVAVDNSGNLYILDWGNDRVRKVVMATGIITTLAGNGTGGPYFGENVPATGVSLNLSFGIAVDSAGNVSFSDQNCSCVRRVNAATGLIATVAGVGLISGSNAENIPATSAQLYPTGVAVDASGNLYIADSGNSRIRKVTASTGLITTVAGPGQAAADYGENIPANRAAFVGPKGVAIDSSGNLYVADRYRVSKISAATGKIVTVAGRGSPSADIGDGGLATRASLGPEGIAVDGTGNLYIADIQNSRVRKVSAGTGIITTIAGNGSEGYTGDNIPAGAAALNRPSGVALDLAGNIYIADTRNNRVRMVAAASGLITTVAGTGAGGYNGDDIAAVNAWVGSPYGVAVDRSGNLYIADTGNKRLRKVTASSGVITTVARGYDLRDLIPAPLLPWLPNAPVSVAVDASDNVYFVDNGIVRKLTVATGAVATVAGVPNRGGYNGDHIAATDAWLSLPFGVAVDPAGGIYVADTYNLRVRGIGVSPKAFSGQNHQGLWWNPSESGWGINLAHQGDVIFATWFTYDTDGKALWMAMTAKKIDPDYPDRRGDSFVGELVQTRGPAFNAAPFDPSAIAVTTVGNGRLYFSDSDPNVAGFSYQIGNTTTSKGITRQVFGPLPTCLFGLQPDLTRATNYQDIWWAAPAGSESGWGVNFAHQGDVIFATWFTYDLDGSPLWLSATTRKTGTGTYTGELLRTTGPAFNRFPFPIDSVVATAVGSVTLTFAHGNSAQFSYTVNGIAQTKRITRQVFKSPGTVCE